MSSDVSLRQELDTLNEHIKLIQAQMDDYLKLTEERIESQEQLVANLMMAYAELASTMETTIQEIMAPRDEKEKADFRRALSQKHAEMLNMIREVANDVEERGPRSSADSILTMAAKQQAAAADTKRSDAPTDEG